MTITQNLFATDQLIATLSCNGRVIITAMVTNFHTIDEIINYIMSAATKFIGLAKLTIRNRTQGWLIEKAVAR